MNKIIVFMAIIICIIIAIIFISNYKNYDRLLSEKQEEEKIQLQLAIEEHQKKYRTLNEIREKYQILEMDMTTENIKKINPKKEYLESLIGNNLLLFIQINNIDNVNGKRIIFTEDERTKAARVNITGLDFVIYDNNEIITNVLINDKIDIEVIVDKVNIIENTSKVSNSPISMATIYFSIIRIDDNIYRNHDKRL